MSYYEIHVFLSCKNEGKLPKLFNSPADGTSVSLPLGCKSEVRPLVEELFINYGKGSPGPLP